MSNEKSCQQQPVSSPKGISHHDMEHVMYTWSENVAQSYRRMETECSFARSLFRPEISPVHEFDFLAWGCIKLLISRLLTPIEASEELHGHPLFLISKIDQTFRLQDKILLYIEFTV